MIILPTEYLHLSFDEIADSFNRSPKVGDDGHVADHELLSKMVFDIPHHGMPVATYRKAGDQWTVTDNAVTDQQIPFSVVRQGLERIGVVAVVQDDTHPAADGETDWTEDSEELDGVTIEAYAAGVAGLPDLIIQIAMGLDARISALEAAQA